MDSEAKYFKREFTKYRKAYYYLLDFWDCLPEGQKEEISENLNKIFGKGHEEYYAEG